MTPRQNEYFEVKEPIIFSENLSMIPKKFYTQERDWTCAFACIRTILSAFDIEITELKLIHQFNLKPGPYYSKNIKQIGLFSTYLPGKHVIYGCDVIPEHSIDNLLILLSMGYYIMLESMINYDHWLVLLSYYALSENRAENLVSVYDSYYNEVRIFRLEELEAMWYSGEHRSNGVVNDYIAIKA